MKFVGVILGTLLSLVTLDAHAQAWVGEGGSLSVAMSTSYGKSNRIVYEGDAQGLLDVNLTNNIAVFSVTYNLIDDLGLDISLPAMAVKLSEDGLDVPLGRYDTGTYHFSFEDLRVGLRYQLPFEALALTPSLGVTVPVADYEGNGNAGLARGLKSLRIGLSLGKIIGDFYLHGNYTFSLVERLDSDWNETGDIDQNFSEGSVLVGYMATDRFHVNLGSNTRIQHDGVAFLNFPELTSVERDFYNVLLHEKHLYATLGVNYLVGDSLTASAYLSSFVWGENTTNQKIIGLGLDWQIR